MRPFGEHPDLLDDRVALRPGGDRVGHQRRLVEPQEQPDHARDVVVVGAALEQAAPRLGAVGLRPLQGLARDPVADRQGQRAQEAFVVLLAVVLGVLDQVELRVLLPLRVQALPGDVGADRRHQVDADHRDQQLQADDAGEDGQHRPGPPAGALALPAHAGWRCRRKRAGQASDFPGKDMGGGYGKNPRRGQAFPGTARRASQSAPMPEPTSSGTLVRKLLILLCPWPCSAAPSSPSRIPTSPARPAGRSCRPARTCRYEMHDRGRAQRQKEAVDATGNEIERAVPNKTARSGT